MDQQTPPPPPPPPTTTIRTATRLQSNRIEKQPGPHSTNGVLRRHRLPPPATIIYGKCLRNHATIHGGVILDGCGEFMLKPASTSQECAACGCHRNFHRLEAAHLQVIECQCNHHHQYHQHPPTPSHSRLATIEKSSSTPESQSPPPISSSHYPVAPHMFVTHNPGLPPPEEVNNHHPSFPTTAVASGSNPNGKKRFRSKFSVDQKEKMQEFAEKIGWKMLKTKEYMILGFCKHIGVTKSVFKVWMHNHKTSSNLGNKRNNHQNHPHHIGDVIGTNGSSSSS